MNDIFSEEIRAIIPIYIADKGNCTIIYTSKGKVEVKATIRTVIRKLCAYYRLDIKASNKYFGEFISVKNLVPLPLSKNQIFIQIKVRRPIGRDDGAMGYFNIDSIKKIKGTSKEAAILLDNNEEIKVLCTQDTVKKLIGQGEMVRNLYDNKQPTINETIEQYMASDTPATKSDIARIYMMVLEIVDRLGKGRSTNY